MSQIMKHSVVQRLEDNVKQNNNASFFAGLWLEFIHTFFNSLHECSLEHVPYFDQFNIQICDCEKLPVRSFELLYYISSINK